MAQPRHFALRTDHLWPLATLICFGCLAALIPIDQVDFWWHVAVGRDIVRLGGVPVTSSHSWALTPNTPFIYGSWLSELLLYGLYRLGGLPLIVLTRNLLLLTAYAVVGLEARRRSGSWRLAALAIGCAGLMALNNVSVRPQIFAWPLFTVTLLLIGLFRAGRLSGRGLLVVPLLMALWVNLHGTFVLGLGILGITAGGETLHYLLGRSDRLSRRHLAWLWLVTALSMLSILCNPRGLGIIEFVKNLVGHPAAQQFGGEWQPPDLLSFPGVLIPLTMLVALLGWIRRPQRFELVDLGLLLAFGWLGISAVRNVIWFGMVAWPIAVGVLGSSKQRPISRRQGVPRFNYGIALLLTVPLVMVQPPFKRGLALGPAFTGLGPRVQDGIYISAETPVEAVDWLRRQHLPVDTRLFHDMRYGSYLIWALPELRVFVDGRIELYPYDLWLRYRQIVEGEDALVELDKLGATHALLSRDGQPELNSLLSAERSGWRQLYADEIALVFERTSPGGSQ